jgi:hypothetical protein
MTKINASRAAVLTAAFVSVIILISMRPPTGNAQQESSQQKGQPQMSYEEAVIRWTYLKVMYYNSIANQEKGEHYPFVTTA